MLVLNTHKPLAPHIGVVMDTGVVHTMEPTAANVADVAMTNELIHGNEDEVYGNRDYTGAEKRHEAKKRNKQGKKIKYKVMRRPSSLKKLSKSGQRKARKAEHQKASIRCKVEHDFGVVKNLFKCRRIRYRGIKKSLCPTAYGVRPGEHLYRRFGLTA